MPDPDLEALLVDKHHVGRALTGPTRILGHRPLRGPLVEVLSVIDVVRTPHLRLQAEQVLCVAEVLD